MLEEVSGGWTHYMFNRVGGLMGGLRGWAGTGSSTACAAVRRPPQPQGLLVGNEILRARTRGVGVLSRETAAAYGVSGPIARASGPTRPGWRTSSTWPTASCSPRTGRAVSSPAPRATTWLRFEVLMEQVHVSLDLAEACVDRMRSLEPGPINVRLPKVLRVPEGHVYSWTENPLGVNGYYLVSRGDKVLWRLKLRSASFNNVQVLTELLPGCLYLGPRGRARLDVLRRRGRRQVAAATRRPAPPPPPPARPGSAPGPR